MTSGHCKSVTLEIEFATTNAQTGFGKTVEVANTAMLTEKTVHQPCALMASVRVALAYGMLYTRKLVYTIVHIKSCSNTTHPTMYAALLAISGKAAGAGTLGWPTMLPIRQRHTLSQELCCSCRPFFWTTKYIYTMAAKDDTKHQLQMSCTC